MWHEEKGPNCLILDVSSLLEMYIVSLERSLFSIICWVHLSLGSRYFNFRLYENDAFYPQNRTAGLLEDSMGLAPVEWWSLVGMRSKRTKRHCCFSHPILTKRTRLSMFDWLIWDSNSHTSEKSRKKKIYINHTPSLFFPPIFNK